MARAALAAELRDLLAWSPALPAGDWRCWVADSHAVRDRAAFLVVRTLFCTFMNTVLLGYLLQTYLAHPLGYWFIYLTNWTLSVQCAYLTLAVYAAWHAGHANAPAAPPRYLPALLYLQGVALPGSALVTLLFWCADTSLHHKPQLNARAPAGRWCCRLGPRRPRTL